MRAYAIVVCGSVSKVFPIQDAVALTQDFVPLGSEVELLAEVAHIEDLLVVLLEQPRWLRGSMGLIQT
jgi:hypothetical protein